MPEQVHRPPWTDPKPTMRVYQQVLDMRGEAGERLEKVLGCSAEEAFETLSGRGVLGPNLHPAFSQASSEPATTRQGGPENAL